MGNWRFGAFPKLPYSTMQQLNLDWILDRIRRFLPDTGTKGQVLTRTKDGAAWVDPEEASGAVSSVNGKTGEVVLTAADVGALPESYVPPAAPVQSVNGQTGAVQLAIPDSTSDLTNDSGFITAAQAAAAAPVQSVNGETGTVVLDALDIPTVDAASVQHHITQIEIDVSDLAAKQFGKSSRKYTGTTDAYGNLGIPKTVIDADTEFAVPLYATGGYISGTTYDSGQIYAKLVRFDASPLSNASVTVYFLV